MESAGWGLIALLWFGGPIGSVLATVWFWDDHRALAWTAMAAIVAQAGGHIANALMVRDRLPDPNLWSALGLLGGVAGLALGACALVM